MRGTQSIEKLARPYYGARPYHNWAHAKRVLAVSLALAERCGEYGISVIEEVLVWAALFHDALYTENSREFGCATAEELSAQVAMQEMAKHGKPEWMIRLVSGAIRATSAKVFPATVEAKILRAADLSGMARGFSDYREDFERLITEFHFSSAWEFFWPNLQAMIGYLWPQIALTPQYQNARGASDWHERVLDNIARNYYDLCFARGVEPRVAVEIGPGQLPISMFRQVPNELIIGIEPDDSARRDAAFFSRDAAERAGRSPELIVPGNSSAIPLADHTIGEILMANVALRCPEAVNEPEFLRVLRGGGRVEVIETYTPTIGFDQLPAISSILAQLPHFELESVMPVSEEESFMNIDPDAFRLRMRRM